MSTSESEPEVPPVERLALKGSTTQEVTTRSRYAATTSWPVVYPLVDCSSQRESIHLRSGAFPAGAGNQCRQAGSAATPSRLGQLGDRLGPHPHRSANLLSTRRITSRLV